MTIYYTYIHSKADTKEIFYVGKGMVSRHRANSKSNRSKYWHNVVKKHGLEVQIASYWESESDAFLHEKFLISCFKDMNISLVNLTNGGDGTSGWVHTDVFRKEQAERTKRNSQNPEIKRKKSLAQKKRFETEHSRKEISEKVKRAWSPEKRAAAAERTRRHAEKHGSPKRFLTPQIVEEMRLKRRLGAMVKDIAKEYGVNKSTATSAILYGTTSRTSARIKSGHATIDLEKTLGKPLTT
jgi:hypothetical protein